MIFTKTTTQHPFFDDFMKPLLTNNWEISKFTPATKVKESEAGYTINIAVPGIPSEDISVEIDSAKNELYIEYAGADTEFVSKFKKTYDIPTLVDTDSIEVDVIQGVLEITMLRKEEVSRKKIF